MFSSFIGWTTVKLIEQLPRVTKHLSIKWWRKILLPFKRPYAIAFHSHTNQFYDIALVDSQVGSSSHIP